MRGLTNKRILQLYDESPIAGLEKRIVDLIDPHDKIYFVRTMLDPRFKEYFMVGWGRTGGMTRNYGIRLMQMGFRVYIFGDAVFPSGDYNSLVIAASGRGKTDVVNGLIDEYKDLGAYTLGLGANEDSPFAEKVEYFIYFPLKEVHEEYVKCEKSNMTITDWAPLGTLIEASFGLFLDMTIPLLMEALEKTEEDLKRKHDPMSKDYYRRS